MFDDLNLALILLFSGLLWFVSFLISFVFNKEISFLGIAPWIIFGWFFQLPLTKHLKTINQINSDPVWLVTGLKFLQMHPLVPVGLILLVFALEGLRYLGLFGDENFKIRLFMILLSIVPSFLFPLISARLISGGWAAVLAVALLLEFLIFYFCKRQMVN